MSFEVQKSQDVQPVQEKTCGSCRHFYKMPPNALNLAVRAGECREQLFMFAVPVEVRPDGSIALHKVCGYAGPLPEDFPACARYRSAVAVLEEE